MTVLRKQSDSQSASTQKGPRSDRPVEELDRAVVETTAEHGGGGALCHAEDLLDSTGWSALLRSGSSILSEGQRVPGGNPGRVVTRRESNPGTIRE